MKEWKKALIAFGPIMLAMWLLIGYFENFKIATISVVGGLAIAAIVAAWVFFVFEILNK